MAESVDSSNLKSLFRVVISVVAGFGVFGILIASMRLVEPVMNYFYPVPVVCPPLSEPQPEGCVDAAIATGIMDNQFLIILLITLTIFGLSLFVSSFVAGFLAKIGTVKFRRSLASGFMVSTICASISVMFVLTGFVREGEDIFSLAERVNIGTCLILWGVPSSIVGLVAGYLGGVCYPLRASNKIEGTTHTS